MNLHGDVTTDLLLGTLADLPMQLRVGFAGRTPDRDDDFLGVPGQRRSVLHDLDVHE